MKNELMIDEIVYITHSEDNFEIFYSSGKKCGNICSYYTLIKSLSENFVRINDSTVVNFDFVSKLTDNKAVTISGESFCVSPKYTKTATNTFFRIKLENFNKNQQK